MKSLVNKCPKLYFMDPKLQIILYTDSSDYAHGSYLCQLQHQEDGTAVALPIWLLSGTQNRWSAIENEAFAIYWALNFFDSWAEFASPFAQTTVIFFVVNNHSLSKVLQWKLEIQHYNAVIERVPGKLNVLDDVFNRLVPKSFCSAKMHSDSS